MKNPFKNLNIKNSPKYSFQKKIILNYAENIIPSLKERGRDWVFLEFDAQGIHCEQIEVCLHDQ